MGDKDRLVVKKGTKCESCGADMGGAPIYLYGNMVIGRSVYSIEKTRVYRTKEKTEHANCPKCKRDREIFG